ncbi:zinc finger CCCH domain-containing protein 30-like isoform X2 [Durio zibethinus]|uniref:Zinc finger CCCH domain-containing protein 30-like isoform X2 n=1 Tax=Durio zibethinus TaxID=66656 RepID=A0A6P6AYY6_DURZI|nr:zinc finger CCCH domain-containing protein 30-like isoform X2 [Durio zibethinus]
MNRLTVKTEYSFSSLLELSSNNDVEGIKQSIEQDASSIDKVGLWYSREKGSNQIVAKHRTPLMVAAIYGSVDAVKLILTHSAADVNLSCDMDKSTALHCATSGGSLHAADVVKLLLSAGADPNCTDAVGHQPADVVVVHPKLQSIRSVLEELLSGQVSDDSFGELNLWVSIDNSTSSSPTLSSSPENGSPPCLSNLTSSPMDSKLIDIPVNTIEKKDCLVDPSLPDIKNSIYATDEFRMFSFKIRPCSRAYSHDWTECPFVHPGENARRRDPPQYRTRLCKDGTSCNRRVCFFAHTAGELRPLYVSTGSSRSSASAANVMDMAAAMSLLPGSPLSVSALSSSPFNKPMSPSSNGISHSSAAWPQPNVPTLNLPGSNLQSSRLRCSLNARDIPPEDFDLLPDFDAQQHILNDLTCFSQSCNSSVSISRSVRSKTLTPSNLEELFSAEISSCPRYTDQTVASAVCSPTHKSSLLNQFQQQQNMFSPINTSVFSPKNVEHPLLQASFGVGSPGRMSPRSTEPISPMAARLSTYVQLEKQQQQLRSLSCRELGSNNPIGSPVNSSWSKWGSPNGQLDWSVSGYEMGQLRRSSSFELGNNGEEPDLSWVQSLVKESPPEMMQEKLAVPVPGGASSGEVLNNSNSQNNSAEHSVIGAWLEQMQLDQLVV